MSPCPVQWLSGFPECLGNLLQDIGFAQAHVGLGEVWMHFNGGQENAFSFIVSVQILIRPAQAGVDDGRERFQVPGTNNLSHGIVGAPGRRQIIRILAMRRLIWWAQFDATPGTRVPRPEVVVGPKHPTESGVRVSARCLSTQGAIRGRTWVLGVTSARWCVSLMITTAPVRHRQGHSWDPSQSPVENSQPLFAFLFLKIGSSSKAL